mmetsp:Transcript_12944/g.18557  ORF Transcript_12944/g.18557 Transcript_12944/m.18557 type:complete len:84 (-) Transcript_12944:824-1075(-)
MQASRVDDLRVTGMLMKWILKRKIRRSKFDIRHHFLMSNLINDRGILTSIEYFSGRNHTATQLADSNFIHVVVEVIVSRWIVS